MLTALMSTGWAPAKLPWKGMSSKVRGPGAGAWDRDGLKAPHRPAVAAEREWRQAMVLVARDVDDERIGTGPTSVGVGVLPEPVLLPLPPVLAGGGGAGGVPPEPATGG